jgi:hypothetical protein
MTTQPQQYPVPNPARPGVYVTPTNLFQQFSVRDVGADVQYRFGYQAACVALYAIVSLLDDDPSHVVVYCEMLEDFLLQRTDGSYAAVQVKTRERDREPFKTSDKEMLSALSRFSEYEGKEGQQFHRYVIATNVGFWKEKQTWRNLYHVHQTAGTTSATPNPDLPSLLGDILNASATVMTSAMSQGILADVFRKLELDNQLPALGAERDAVRNALVKHLGNPTVREIDYVVGDLIAFVRECSDRSLEDRTGVRRVLAEDPGNAHREMRVTSKKITREALYARLAAASKVAEQIEIMQATTTSLASKGPDLRGKAFRDNDGEPDRRVSTDMRMAEAANRAVSKDAKAEPNGPIVADASPPSCKSRLVAPDGASCGDSVAALDAMGSGEGTTNG